MEGERIGLRRCILWLAGPYYLFLEIRVLRPSSRRHFLDPKRPEVEILMQRRVLCGKDLCDSLFLMPNVGLGCPAFKRHLRVVAMALPPWRYRLEH